VPDPYVVQGCSKNTIPVPHLDDKRCRYYRLHPYGRNATQAKAAPILDSLHLPAVRFQLIDMPDRPPSLDDPPPTRP